MGIVVAGGMLAATAVLMVVVRPSRLAALESPDVPDGELAPAAVH